MAKFDSQYPEQVSPEEGDKFLIASEQDGEIMSLQFGTVIKSIEKQLNQVDDKLSTTSLKPVQNKVITMAINEILTELQSAAKEATLESVQSRVNQVYNEGAKQGTLTETALQIRQGFDKILDLLREAGENQKSYVHDFSIGLYDVYYTISGSLSSSYSKEVKGAVITQSLNMESNSHISFTSEAIGTLVIYASNSKSASFNVSVDGENVEFDADGKAEIVLAAGEHTITKGTANTFIFYIELVITSGSYVSKIETILSKEEVILLYLKALGTDVRGIIRGREQIYIPTDETVEESGSIRYRILRIDGEVYWSDALNTSGVIYNSPTSQEEIDRIMQYYPSIRKIDSVIRALQLNVEELSDSARSYKNEIIHAIEEAVTPVIKTLPHYVYDEGILRLPYSEAMSYVDVTDYVNQILKLGFNDLLVEKIVNCESSEDTVEVILSQHYIDEEDGTDEIYYQKVDVREILDHQYVSVDLTQEWESFIRDWDGKGFIYVELDFGMMYYILERLIGEPLFDAPDTPSSIYFAIRYPVDMEKLSAFPEIGYRNECDILTQNEV